MKTTRSLLLALIVLSGWEAMLRDSKFNDSESESSAYLGDARWHDFGKFSRGHICFQDHPERVSFRNVFIREIP
jgi:hypothetical protein